MPMRPFVEGKNRLLVSIASLATLGTAAILLWLVAGSGGPGERELALRVPAPIVLVHGLGGSADGWLDEGYVEYLEARGVRYGGVVRGKDGASEISAGRAAPETAEVFVFEVSDPWASLARWKEELEAGIDEVTRRTGAPKVILMGFSAGGLAARRYLVEHLEDHKVERLVTVATPHGGSELAVAAAIQRKAKGVPGAGRLVDVAEKLEEAAGLQPNAPLIEELMPPEDGTYLGELNSRPHPEDVDYACVLAGGSPWAASWKELQTEIARTRRLDKSGSLWERFSAGFMAFVGTLAGKQWSSGDGAVLVASQHLGRAEWFRVCPDLIRKVVLVEGGHLQAKRRHRVLTEAMTDHVEFLRARRTWHDGDAFLVLDYRTPLPLASTVEATAGPAGDALENGRPVVIRRDGEAFARLELGPLAEEAASEIRVRITPPAGSSPRGAVLQPAPASGTAEAAELPSTSAELRRLELTIHAVFGATEKRWDLLPLHGGPDVRVVLFVNDSEVFRSEQLDDCPNAFRFGAQSTLELDTRSDQVRLELWDMDGGEIPQRMGAATWPPGRLRTGRSLVAVSEDGDPPIGVDLEISSADGDSTRWVDEPIYWR